MSAIKLKTLIYLFGCSLLFGCHQVDEKIDFRTIKTIELIDHTGNDHLIKSTEITLPAQMNCIILEVKRMSLCKGEVNLKANHGFIEIVVYDSKNELTLDLIYTTLDGIIIYDEGANLAYKNDKLKTVIENLMSKN